MTNRIQNEIKRIIQMGSFSIFGIAPAPQNKNAFYSIIRCNFETTLKQDLKNKFASDIDSIFELEQTSYTPNAQISDTLITCDVNNYGIKDRLSYLINSSNHHSWDRKQFDKSKYFLHEFILNNEKILIISKCPTGWKLKGKFMVSIIENDTLAKAENNNLLFNDFPEIIVYKNTIYTLYKNHLENFFKIEDGLIHQLDEFISDSVIINNMDNLLLFQQTVQKKKRFLNQLSDAYIKGKYKEENFWAKVKSANRRHKWGLVFKKEKLQITDENIQNILYILKDGKVESMITKTKYDMELGVNADDE